MPSIDIIAALIFVMALIHDFSTMVVEHLAHVCPRHAGLFRRLGEVRVVFAFFPCMPLRTCRPLITARLCRCGWISACSRRSSHHAFAKSMAEPAKPVANGRVASVRCKTLAADHHPDDIRPARTHRSP